MAFKIAAAKRIEAAEDVATSFVPEIIPLLTKALGKPKGSGHNLTWKLPIGEVDLIITLSERPSARFGVDLSVTIPDIGYRKSPPLNQNGWSAQRYLESLLNFHYDIQKLPKYKALDPETKQLLIQFKQKHAPY